jgi:hypothetical protein
MDFSKLNQNEKLAVYGSAAVIVGGLVGFSYGLTILAVVAAIALLAVIFLPQMSPGTSLPGSRGSLMLLLGGVAGVVLVLALLVYIGVVFTAFGVGDLFFLLAVAGGVVAAWAGWQAFQAEGGKFQLGSSASAASGTTTTDAPSQTTASTPPPVAPPPPPAADTTGDSTVGDADEERRSDV